MSPLFPIVILAGGLATRLRPITQAIPKSLVDINGEPFVAHQMRLLKQKGIEDVVMCIGYLGAHIRDYLQDGRDFGLRITYVEDGPTLLGTAGAIKRAIHCLPEVFFVLNGDSYLPCDYVAVQLAFMNSQKMALMTVFHNKDQWDISNVEFAQDAIIAYDKLHRTERMLHIDYGLEVFTRAAFDNVPENQPYDLVPLYQKLLQKQQLAAYEVHERFYENGSFTGIAELAYYLAQQKTNKEPA